MSCYKDYDTPVVEESLEAPVPWVGMYIALASAVCAFAMASDAFKGFKTKRLWFPCKYFSLNATSLTLLAIAMKLTVDLTTLRPGVNDKIASVSSLVLMSTAIGNFMISVASMNDSESLLNLTALAILVITIATNVCIHSVQTRDVPDEQVVLAEEIAAIIFMLLLLILLCSSAIVVSTNKRYIELKYQDLLKMVLNERTDGGKYTVDELRTLMKKYWVMAETGSPQFVMVRSAISIVPGVMCLLMAFTLAEAHIRMTLLYSYYSRACSNYKWSIDWILFIQTGGVALGTIAPVSRWLISVQFKISNFRSFKEELKIERYWIQRLVDWRESSISLRIRHFKGRKVLHKTKRLVLDVFIRIQNVIVLASKLVLILSAMCIVMTFVFFRQINKLKLFALRPSNDENGSESRTGTELNFSRYVLLLEGEPELPKKTIANICSEVDKLIQRGKREKPKHIIKLLQKSENINGVREFDSTEASSLHSQEPPNCWSLPVVTLTSIVVALPNIPNAYANQLLNAVNEGLSFVKLIEKTIDTNGELISIRNAADVVWVELELNHKWQDNDVVQGTNQGDTAEKIVLDFKTKTTDIFMENPLNWPAKVIAANSMYRICQTILLAEKDGIGRQTNLQMFERLCMIISGILAACFTNLARVITMKCESNVIEEREEIVRRAAVLLGESEEIIEFLQQREWPSLDPHKAGYIDEWRAFLEQDSENRQTTPSDADNGSISNSSSIHVSIEVGN